MFSKMQTYTSSGTVFRMYLPVMLTFLTFTSLPISILRPLSTAVAPYIEAESWFPLYLRMEFQTLHHSLE